MRLRFVAAVAALLLSWTSFGATPSKRDATKLPPPAAKSRVTYDQDIQPLFAKACLKCHGAEKPKGRLRLDSPAHVLKGGEEGQVVVPGSSAESVLVYAVARSQAEAMPPKGKGDPLTPEQVGLIRAWIDQGAK